MMVIRIDLADGGEADVTVHTKRIVCPTCDGRGRQDVFGNGVPNEYFDDPDFAEDYGAGVYDRPCGECNGRNVVEVIDYDRLDDLTREQVEWHEEQQAQYRHEVEAEQRFFARAAEAMSHW